MHPPDQTIAQSWSALVICHHLLIKIVFGSKGHGALVIEALDPNRDVVCDRTLVWRTAGIGGTELSLSDQLHYIGGCLISLFSRPAGGM
jgi:hypothetical protein